MKERKFGILTITLQVLTFLLIGGVGKAAADDNSSPGNSAFGHDQGSLKSELAHARHHGLCTMSSDGCAILTLDGTRGQTYAIQASSDMKNWTNIGTVTADSKGLCQFIDATARNYPHRFYRMVNP